MSNTERRNGSRVLDAARRVAYRRGSMFRGMFTIGEVVEASGMSRPSVTKYLKKCIEYGMFETVKFDRHLTVFVFKQEIAK